MRPHNKENSLVALDTMRYVLRFIAVSQAYSNIQTVKQWENKVELIMMEL